MKPQEVAHLFAEGSTATKEHPLSLEDQLVAFGPGPYGGHCLPAHLRRGPAHLLAGERQRCEGVRILSGPMHGLHVRCVDVVLSFHRRLDVGCRRPMRLLDVVDCFQNDGSQLGRNWRAPFDHDPGAHFHLSHGGDHSHLGRWHQ